MLQATRAKPLAPEQWRWVSRMRYAIVMLVGMYSLHAEAKDFRVVDLGESCATIREREEALGTKPIPWSWSDPINLHTFKGREFERDVHIVYLCKEGSFFVGNYFFEKESLDAAIDTMEAVYLELSSIYGAPDMDSTPWQFGPGIVAYDHAYGGWWREPRFSIRLSLMCSGDREDAESPIWQVMMVVSEHGRQK